MRYDIYRQQEGNWELAAVTDERKLAARYAERYYKLDSERYIDHAIKVWDNEEKRWFYKRGC